MKKIIITGLLFFACIIAGKSQQSRLTGEWMNIDQGDTGYLRFDPKGYVFFTFKDEGETVTVGGKNYDMMGIALVDMKYKTDTAKNPGHIDIIMYRAGTDSIIGIMTGIFKFENNKVLKMAVTDFGDFGDEGMSAEQVEEAYASRPKTFDEETQVFTRVK